MHKLTNALLAVIAVAVSAIAFKMYMTKSSATYSEVLRLQDVKDATQRQEVYKEILGRMQLVRVQGGSLEVTGSVDVDNLYQLER